MAFLDQEISFDMGHLILLIALVGFIFFVANRCRLSCGGNVEGLATEDGGNCPAGINVGKVHWKSCRCPACVADCGNKANTGQLYGCNPNNPYVPYGPEECEYSYRKCTLHGCGVA